MSASIIREAPARELIAAIEDPSVRIPIGVLVDSLVDFYRADPTQLHGAFDLVFFVHVLEERIDDVSGLLQGTIPVEDWFDDYPKPVPVDEGTDSGPTGLRQRQAFIYVAKLDEPLRAALLNLTARANLKQVLLLPTIKGWKHHGNDAPPVPEALAEPFDFLFMVMAVDHHALKPGQPACSFIEHS